jgi:hypothetical protein
MASPVELSPRPPRPEEEGDPQRAGLLALVDVEVRGGFVSEDELLEGLQERVEAETGEPASQALLDGLAEYVRRRFVAQRREEARWRERTVNDRIDRAFDELTARGILALQNVGYTVADGWEDTDEAADEQPRRPRGAVFFHGQDLERGVSGRGLLLAFGAYGAAEGAAHEEASAVIGQEVCEVLRRHGVDTLWCGSSRKRIEIPPFPWRKRRWTAAP